MELHWTVAGRLHQEGSDSPFQPGIKLTGHGLYGGPLTNIQLAINSEAWVYVASTANCTSTRWHETRFVGARMVAS